MDNQFEKYIEHNYKMDFANFMNEIDDGIPKTGNECFKYGIVGGCDEWCPVHQRGECEIQDIVKGMIERRGIK